LQTINPRPRTSYHLPLLWLSAGFILGLAAADGLGGRSWQWALAGALCLAAGLAGRRWLKLSGWQLSWGRICSLPFGVVLAAICAGAVRFQIAKPVLNESYLGWYNNRENIHVVGVIAEAPFLNARSTTLVMDAEQIFVGDGNFLPVKGRLRVVLPWNPAWQYGDRVELTGDLTAPGKYNPSYQEYLARQGIASQMNYPQVQLMDRGKGDRFLTVIYRLRASAVQRVNTLLPQPEAALLSGILLGDDSQLPGNLEDAFQITGTAHIIAISGFNIAVLIGLLLALARRIFSRRWAALAAIAGISLYTLLVGAQPPVVRAAIMGTVGLLGEQIGRRQMGVNSLAFTAATMCVFNPNLPWDASFQLSFMATLGLVILAGPMQASLTSWMTRRLPFGWGQKISAPVGEYLVVTLAAQIATLPILAYHFQRVSLISLIANPLILPPQPLVMIVGGLALLASLIWLPIGKALAWLAWPLLAYTTRMVELLGNIPQGAIATGSVSPWVVTACYLILFAILAGWKLLPSLRRWATPVVITLVLLLASITLWRSVLARPDGRLHITILPGSGNPSVLMNAPNGETLLLYGGYDPAVLGSDLGRRLPPGKHRLDWVVLTDADATAVRNMQVLLTSYPAGQVLWPASASTSRTGEWVAEWLAEQKTGLTEMRTGTRVNLGDEGWLEVLVTDGTDSSLLLAWDRLRMVFPAGIPFLPGDPPPGYLLILSERDRETDPITWQAALPAMVIWAGNTPAPDNDWLNVVEHGWTQITTDGVNLWVDVQR
jgi:competence protein ComEC